MAKKRQADMVCPDCEGRKTMLYRDEDGEYVDKCELCNGTGIFSDVDTKEKFYGRYDFNG